MSERLERWLISLGALGEHELRVATARRQLYEGAAFDTAEALHELCVRAESERAVAREALFAFVPVVADPAHVERMSLVREASKRHHLHSACRMLRCTTKKGHRLERGEGDEPLRTPVMSADPSLSLGERRALARRPTRQLLQKVLADPHPMVASILLGNPRVTEDDVVTMAASRRAEREVLSMIAMRQVRSARVRIAVVSNPNTPPAVSVPLLYLLLRPELADVAHAPSLPAVVRTTAHELWELRPPMPPGEAPELVH